MKEISSTSACNNGSNNNSTATTKLKSQLLIKFVGFMDKGVCLWRDKSSLIELLASYNSLLKHIVKYTASSSNNNNSVDIPLLLTKFTKLQQQALYPRKPLTLRYHKSIAITTRAPKFEENFNPHRKTYDENKDRQGLSKARQQLKQEREAALKDIRYENQFVAREQIGKKKKMYDEHHRNMASIVNTI